MLLEKCQQLIELSQKKKEQQSFINNLQAFQIRQKQINDAVEDIQPLIEALQVFRQKGMKIDVNQKADFLLKFIINAEENFQNNPDWIIDKNNFKGNVLKSNIESLKKTLEQELNKAWKNYLHEYMPSTNNEILVLLSKIETFKHTVQEIQILDRDIKEINYPKNDSDFDKYERKIEQLKLSWNSLSSDEVSPEVLDFLKAAADQGAALSLWTPEVQDWIHRHNISDSLKIRLN